MTTRQLLDKYYEGFARKEGWEAFLSDDFIYVGGDMTNTTPIVGKAAYIDVIKRFSRLYQMMRVKEMIIMDDRAFVLANYDYVFPRGQAINGDVAELWHIRDGKLAALRIFFDTHTFHVLTTE